MSKPNCSECRHFYITWNPSTPNGCRKFGIQCQGKPSMIVAQAGMGECQGFTPKVKKTTNKDELDLNRKDLW